MGYLEHLNCLVSALLEFVDDECVKESLLEVPGCMFSEDMKSWLRVAWSIEHEDLRKELKH